MSTSVNGAHGVWATRRAPDRSARFVTRRTLLGSVLSSVVLAGCGAQDSPTAAPVVVDSVPPAEFAAVVSVAATYVLNVHTPDEGSIAGTDAAIPFDQVRRRAGELPERSTPVAVYCRTGRMSAEALPTLRELGFTRLTELSGGMDAWQAEGRELQPARDSPR